MDKKFDNEEGIKFAANIDFSRVEPNDRVEVRGTVLAILKFEYPMPKVGIEIYSTPDHYNIIVSDWRQELDGPKLYDYFCGSKHDPALDNVITFSIVPVTDEGKAVLKFKVRKSAYSKQKKRFTK